MPWLLKNHRVLPGGLPAESWLWTKGIATEAQASPVLSGQRSGLYLLSPKRSSGLTVISMSGKEATITLLTAGDFIGEESIAALLGLRTATSMNVTLS